MSTAEKGRYSKEGFLLGRHSYKTDLIPVESLKEAQLNKEKRIKLDARQKQFLTDITALSPLISDIQLIGCGKCDVRIKRLCSPAHTINDALLVKQLTFKPPVSYNKQGVFEFHHIFYDTYNYLPSFLKESQNAVISISRKMAKFTLTRQDLNYKLASDYLNGKST